MKTPSLTKLAVSALEDLKAQDIQVLDVRGLTAVTDHMVICTGTSSRHVKAIAQNLITEAKHHGIQPMGMEGLEQGEWALVDLNGVVVHVMQLQARAFYQLEKLWHFVPPEGEVVKAKPARKKAAAKKPASKKTAARKSPAKKKAAKAPSKAKPKAKLASKATPAARKKAPARKTATRKK